MTKDWTEIERLNSRLLAQLNHDPDVFMPNLSLFGRLDASLQVDEFGTSDGSEKIGK